MRPRFVILVLLLCASPPLGAANLVAPYRQGNLSRLDALASQGGARELAPDLRSPDRLTVIAAATGAPAAHDAWALLGTLAERAGDADRSIAVVAVRAGLRIASNLDPMDIDEQEIPTHDLVRWQKAWAHIADDSARWVDIRVYALETAAALSALSLPQDREELVWKTYLDDADPEMRAGAVAVLPEQDELLGLVLERLADPSPEVAVAAGRWRCGPLGATKKVSAALDNEQVARLLSLATMQALPIEARVDLAPCLAAVATPEAKRALDILTRQSPPALRSRLRALSKVQAPQRRAPRP